MSFEFNNHGLVQAAELLKHQCHGAAVMSGWWLNPRTGEDPRSNTPTIEESDWGTCDSCGKALP